MRVFATVITYLVSLALVAVVVFFIVIFLAGPHSDLLPSWLGGLVVGTGWLAVLLLPIFFAGLVWRRLATGVG